MSAMSRPRTSSSARPSDLARATSPPTRTTAAASGAGPSPPRRAGRGRRRRRRRARWHRPAAGARRTSRRPPRRCRPDGMYAAATSSPGISGISGSRLRCRVSAAVRSARNSRTLSSASPARRPRCAAVTTASAREPVDGARGSARRAPGRARAAAPPSRCPGRAGAAGPAASGVVRAGQRRACRSRRASRRSPGPLVSASVTLGARESQLMSWLRQRAGGLAVVRVGGDEVHAVEPAAVVGDGDEAPGRQRAGSRCPRGRRPRRRTRGAGPARR